jgi:hypothetical protein
MQTLARNFVTPYYTQTYQMRRNMIENAGAEPPYGLGPQIFLIFSIIGT